MEFQSREVAGLNGKELRIALAALLAVALLLGGCNGSGELPAGNHGQSVPPTAAPTAKALPATSPERTAPTEPTETVSATQPPKWDFPLAAAGLFGAQGLPETFLFPLRIWEDGSQFLFATSDGRVLRARWDGVAYTAEPVAEQLETGSMTSAFVDIARKRLFAPAGKGAGQAIVMVDLATTARCDLCEMAGWKADGLSLAGGYQCAGGVVLARLTRSEGGTNTILDQWVIIDAEKRDCSIIDLTGFAAQRLGQWQQAKAERLILLGNSRLLCLWSVRGVPAGQAAEESAVVAFVLDRSGAVEREVGTVKAENGSALPAIAGGSGFSPSPDGNLLVYGGADGGVWLYDLETNMERALEGGKAKLTFSQWDGQGNLIYGTGSGASATIRRLVLAGAGNDAPASAPGK